MQLPVTKRIVIPQAAQTLNTIITIFQLFIRQCMLRKLLLMLCVENNLNKDMSLGEANGQKVKLTKMALNHLQEPRDIKIRQCKHNVSHFIQIIFYT